MGTVFKARHRRMNRVVALKVLSRDTAGQSSFAQRFQREVETVAQLAHPNIVMAYDAGESENGLYLVMEFVDGHDLGSEVAQRGPLSAADAVECIIQAAGGLACAHDRGVVHRDVKPANLLRDAAGVVKVADLGLAQLNNPETNSVNASLTQAGSILGTVDYMAPEQALDAATVDHRVDIYSLGCTLFFLLTGRPMYSAELAHGPAAETPRRRDPVAVAKLGPTCPPSWTSSTAGWWPRGPSTAIKRWPRSSALWNGSKRPTLFRRAARCCREGGDGLHRRPMSPWPSIPTYRLVPVTSA